MDNTANTFAVAIAQIKGRVLSSVEFVQDYVQLRFDGPCLTAYTQPQVSLKGSNFVWGQQRYCDALCSSIGQEVTSTEVTDDELIVSLTKGM